MTSEQPTPIGLNCQECGTPLTRKKTGPPPTYCSGKCRAKAGTRKAKADGRWADALSRKRAETADRRLSVPLRPCEHCCAEFRPATKRSRYCSPRCNRNANRDSSTKTCGADDCARPCRARGLCDRHWRQRYGKRTKYLITCIACGEQHQSDRANGKYCTDWCKGWHYAEKAGGNVCTLPDTHPVLSSRLPADHPARVRPSMSWVGKTHRIYIPDCRWCGKAFVTQQPKQVMCSKRCTRKETKATRKALEHGAPGTYTWSEVMGLFLKFGRCCAYCRAIIKGQPEPDHVIPLSRGGSNSLTNILPACRACNSSKSDRTPTEWAEYLHLNGRPARVTSWERGDPLYTHLALGEPTRPSWRDAA